MEHKYTDHGAEDDSFDYIPPGLSRHLFPLLCGGRGTDQSFPEKLHYLLEHLEKEGLDSVCSWQPHGRCFVVHKPNEFVKHILPRWFRQTKLPSFQRQLNLYGFKRLTSGRDKGGYYHELFLRQKRWLCMRIGRSKIKGTRVRKAASPEQEPSFYDMPFLPKTSCSKGSAFSRPLVVMDPSVPIASFPSGLITQQLARPVSASDKEFAELATNLSPLITRYEQPSDSKPHSVEILNCWIGQNQGIARPSTVAVSQTAFPLKATSHAESISSTYFEDALNESISGLDASTELADPDDFDQLLESLLSLPAPSTIPSFGQESLVEL